MLEAVIPQLGPVQTWRRRCVDENSAASQSYSFVALPCVQVRSQRGVMATFGRILRLHFRKPLVSIETKFAAHSCFSGAPLERRTPAGAKVVDSRDIHGPRSGAS